MSDDPHPKRNGALPPDTWLQQFVDWLSDVPSLFKTTASPVTPSLFTAPVRSPNLLADPFEQLLAESGESRP